MTLELALAAGGLLLTLQGATLFYVVSIERRLTRLETLQEITAQRPASPGRPGKAAQA